MNQEVNDEEQFQIKVLEVEYLSQRLNEATRREAQLNALLNLKERELQELKQQETSAE